MSYLTCQFSILFSHMNVYHVTCHLGKSGWSSHCRDHSAVHTTPGISALLCLSYTPYKGTKHRIYFLKQFQSQSHQCKSISWGCLLQNWNPTVPWKTRTSHRGWNLGPLQVSGKSQVVDWRSHSLFWAGTQREIIGLAWGPSPGREDVGFGVSALVVYLQASSELM